MSNTANAINCSSSGIIGFNGSSFTASNVTQYNNLVGGASTDQISNLTPQATGKLLQSGGGASNPAFSTATYPSTATGSGTILRADGTNWGASTPTYANTASTSGKFLISDGTNFVTSTPTFPNTSATARKIIVSDGTNWTDSTETYATPGPSGNVMSSDGTNWLSLPPAKLKTVKASVTNAQLKAATPVLILAAQGAGTIIMPTTFVFKFVYGGSNVFTNTPQSTVNWGSTFGTGRCVTNGGGITFWQASTSRYRFENRGTITFNAATIENLGMYATFDTGATGNAANDNTFVIQMFYYVIGF